MPIVITGERGASKTCLYSALIDNHSQRRPEVSANAETARVSIGNKLTSTFIVVPGQDSDPQNSVLDRIFTETRSPTGVIHVVTAGYDWVWEDRQRGAIEEQLDHQSRARKEEIAKLQEVVQKSDTAAPEVEERLSLLKNLELMPAIWHLREHLKKEELKRFRSLREKLRNTWGRTRKENRPLWLIVAVNKCDLWYDEIEAVRSYYLPRDSSTDSPFATELRELVNDVSESRRVRLAVLPVSIDPNRYQFSRNIGEQRPAFGRKETDSLINYFRNVIGEFCGLAEK